MPTALGSTVRRFITRPRTFWTTSAAFCTVRETCLLDVYLLFIIERSEKLIFRKVCHTRVQYIATTKSASRRFFYFMLRLGRTWHAWRVIRNIKSSLFYSMKIQLKLLFTFPLSCVDDLLNRIRIIRNCLSCFINTRKYLADVIEMHAVPCSVYIRHSISSIFYVAYPCTKSRRCARARESRYIQRYCIYMYT